MSKLIWMIALGALSLAAGCTGPLPSAPELTDAMKQSIAEQDARIQAAESQRTAP